MAKSYAPAVAESEVQARWDAAGAFRGTPAASGESYCIVIPPPNVTAALHLGHALNNSLQDVLIRYHRMRGFNTLWMPGTDHAGISTQTVVEKRLLQEGKHRAELGREQFVARVQAWKDEYEATIIEQLKAIGCSCAWDRVRFTMDDMCATAVREAFFRFFRDGLIYRGKRLVNWDPVTQTALADDEVEMQEVAGHMWYLRYPLVPAGDKSGGEFLTVATTRPETMLGDTAVAINPRDALAEALVGRQVRLPIVDRVVPIIADDYVVRTDDPDNPMAEYATGFLKVTPAHDPNDWEIGLRHGLDVINILAPDGSISADHGWRDHEDPSPDATRLLGLSREAAREKVVEWFTQRGLLEEIRDYRHSVGHSYRSHVAIEPYLSDQWYVKVTDDRMRVEALRAQAAGEYDGDPPPRPDGSSRPGDGELRFFPARYARTYQAWHENLRDWCISRQLWWGHRIPVWSRFHALDAGLGDDVIRERLDEHVGGLRGAADACAAHQGEARPDGYWIHVCVAPGQEAYERQLEADGFEQDPDVLDTWFSSALWPISTMGWPQPQDFPETIGLLEAFNPSAVLVTARDIITLWVSRMVMFNRYFRDGLLPFRHVYINPMIQDGHGQRMSKSLGNGVDPRDIIHSHGADALRFALAQIATSTQDVRVPVDMVCPHCDATFHPTEKNSSAGYRVAVPQQDCPQCGGSIVSAYGVASGLGRPSDEQPLARNSSRQFDDGRNFANKLWNATRFALSNLDSTPASQPEAARRALADRWIIARLAETLRAVETAVAEYQFNVYADAMYDLVWRSFCDWYLEAIKPTVRTDSGQQQVLRTVLNAILRMLHPICPFVTEALWPHVVATGEAGLDGVRLEPAAPPDLLACAPWPRIDDGVADSGALDTFARIQALTAGIRNLRSEHKVPPKKKVRLHATPEAMALIDAGPGIVETLAGLESVTALDAKGAGPGARGAVIPLAFEGRELLLSGLAEAVDVGAERARLTKLRQQKEKAAEGYRRKLANESYVSKAPAHLVQETRARLVEAEADFAAACRALDLLEDEG
ncbi:MAG: valine--tRNA ligase [Planctomycetota bacterium]